MPPTSVENLIKGKEKEKKNKIKLSKAIAKILAKRREQSYRREINLKKKIKQAGYTFTPKALSRMIISGAVLVTIILGIYLLKVLQKKPDFITPPPMILGIWFIIGVLISIFILWFMFYLSIDMIKYKRKQKVEKVLPDFLQLASSNIRAGMTVDQALWFAVRPRFGILAKEIEEVAKRTYAGEQLETALKEFVAKYDSKLLERSINLLVEGMKAGGEIGDLMTKISTNIQETSIMKKEMSANVTTYVIFITFASIVAAPFLFAMAYHLISVIQQIFSKMTISPGAGAGMPLQISKEVISLSDFNIFVIVSLIITSTFSAMIISTIRKGNIKGGIRYIPTFIIVSIILYMTIVKVMGVFVGGFFG